MKGSILILLFSIFFNTVMCVISIMCYYKNKKLIDELDKYNEELFFEIAKLRRKCYSKNKEE